MTLGASFGCGSTTDSLGGTKQPTVVLTPLKGPTKYPNVFRDIGKKTETEIDKKVEDAFQQLFHGDPTDEAIYFPTGNYADIYDVLHKEHRTEGYGLAMLIAVELNKREEFDNVWRGALRLRSMVPSSKAYFKSRCDVSSTTANNMTSYVTEECLDPFGLEQFVMALIFANDVWKEPRTIDYAAAASDLLYLLRNVEDVNGGIVEGVTNTFDAKAKLVFHLPNVSAKNVTRPSLEIPAYYALWAQATGDSFFSDAATAGRAYVNLAAHPMTGLTPVRASFDGDAIAPWDTFQAESYRVQLNLVLDALWTENADAVALSNRILTFFTAQQVKLGMYGSEYSLDGMTVLNPMQQGSLIAANGMSAVKATVADRKDYVDAMWELPLSTGEPRYFSGLMELLSLLALSGKLKVL